MPLSTGLASTKGTDLDFSITTWLRLETGWRPSGALKPRRRGVRAASIAGFVHTQLVPIIWGFVIILRSSLTAMARSLLVLGLLALATQAGALNAPVRMGSSAKQTSPSMDRRAALSSIIAGAVIASGAAPAMAGLPEVVKCPAPQNVCDSWKEGKKPSPTFAEVRARISSPLPSWMRAVDMPAGRRCGRSLPSSARMVSSTLCPR